MTRTVAGRLYYAQNRARLLEEIETLAIAVSADS